MGGVRSLDDGQDHLATILFLGGRLTVVVGASAVGGAGRDWVSRAFGVEENPQEGTMNALVGFAASLWNVVPAVITAANGIVHVAHDTLHQVASLITITLK